MSPDTVKAIQDALTPLAQKLNESAEFVFKAYVLHAYAFGVALAIGGIVATLVAIALVVVSARQKDSEIWIMTFIPVIVTAVVGLGLLGSGIMHLIAPQYYAIHDILCTVKECH